MKDQDYFDIVAGELQDRQVKPGLWTRAIAESGQDDGRARAAYIKLRIRELKEEDEQQRKASEAASKNIEKLNKPQKARRASSECLGIGNLANLGGLRLSLQFCNR